MSEEQWRSGGEGRVDANGTRWWACDPYPTWYRWEDGVLYTSGAGVPVGAVIEYPSWEDD